MANFTENPKLGNDFAIALEFAFNLHINQIRKDPNQTPYFAHLMAVTSLVLEAGGDEKTAITALLHDSIEDRGVTVQEIEKIFGIDVAELVEEVSENKSLPKEERKEEYAKRIATMSEEALLIMLADKLHNIRCIAQGQAPALVNNSTYKFYNKVCTNLIERGNHLNIIANEQLSELANLISFTKWNELAISISEVFSQNIMNLPEKNKLVLVEIFSNGQTIYDLVKFEDDAWFCPDGEGYYFTDEIVKWCYVEDIKEGWNEIHNCLPQSKSQQ